MEPNRNKIFLKIEEWISSIENNADKTFDYYRAYTPEISNNREFLKGLSEKEYPIYANIGKKDSYYIDNDTYIKFLKIYYTTIAHKTALDFYDTILNLIQDSLTTYYISKTAPEFSRSTLKFLYPRLSQLFNAFQHLTTVRDWEVKVIHDECYRRYTLNRNHVLSVPYTSKFPPSILPDSDKRYVDCAITGQYGIKPPIIMGNQLKEEGHLNYRNHMVLYSVLIYNLWALYAKLPPWELIIKPQMQLTRSLVKSVNLSFSSNEQDRVKGCVEGLRYIIDKLNSDVIHVADVDQISGPDFEAYIGSGGLYDSFINAPQFNLPSDPSSSTFSPPISPSLSSIPSSPPVQTSRSPQRAPSPRNPKRPYRPSHRGSPKKFP